MEITLAYPKSILNHHMNDTIPAQQFSPNKAYSVSPHHLSPQIPLLQKPQHRPSQPSEKTTTGATSSDILHLMDSLNLPIPLDFYISLIKECTKDEDPSQAIELSRHIIKSRLKLTLPLLNRILLMYVACSCYDHARLLFDKMPLKNLNTWAAIITGCVENFEYDEAIYMFIDMLYKYEFGGKYDGTLVDFLLSGVLICVLKACVGAGNLEAGKQVHGWILKMGYWRSTSLSSFLITFYGKFGCLEGGESVFNHIPCRNTAAWTARIVNYRNEERFEDAVTLFIEMAREGVNRNKFTLSSVLKACVKLMDGECCGRQVHANALKLGLDLDSYVLCGLIDMYGKRGLVNEARRVLEMSAEKNDACWNALLTSYTRHGSCVEAVKLLYDMKAAGLRPPRSLLNEVRLVCGSCIT